MDPTTPLPPVLQPPQPDQIGQPPVEEEVVSSARVQVADVLKKSKNVLVTVGMNPSVDELAAALGLTVLLGKLGKHATAVFSGKIPPAIEFLDPEKTFEDSVDSLRDFIIALDKEKADKLRYKVEDDVVKIFITPYRTVIGEKDLEFSQGDFNVDVVVALGVEKKEGLDKAITAHGRILHDATFVIVTAGEADTSAGTINWNEGDASSIAEMLVHLSGEFEEEILDSQISTAFLTGIVAETNRFSNDKTTPKVMTMSAQLMAAGANQQLIASNLRQEGMISESVRLQKTDVATDDGEMVLTHKSVKVEEKTTSPKKQPVKPALTMKSDDTSKKSSDQTKSEPKKTVPPVSVTPVIAATPSEDVSTQKETTPAEVVTVAAPEMQIPSARKVIIPPSEDAGVSGGIPPVEAVQTTEITPPVPPTPDPVEKPQFGGALNSFADSPAATSGPASEQFTLTHEATSIDAIQKEAVDAARKAVEDAAIEPPHQQPEPIGAMPLSETPIVPLAPINEPPMPQPEENVAPIISPTPAVPPQAPVVPPLQETAPFAPTSFPSSDIALPPMPPLPPTMDGALPPLPPLPGQSTTSNPAMSPQTTPSFLQDLQQSQNNWTQAGQSVAEMKAAADAGRQVKIDERLQDYDQAVERNRELQGLPPANNPYNSGGLPPLMPPR